VSGIEIESDISSILEDVKKYAENEPVYSLLLCRKVGEAILMQKHLELVKDGVPKKILTLGDLDNPKLRLVEEFDPLQIAAIRYIRECTNPFLHYRTNPLPVANKSVVQKVLDQIYSIISPEISSTYSAVQAKKANLGWKETLISELEELEWPKINDTILSTSHLGLLKGKFTKRKRTLIDNPPPTMPKKQVKAELKKWTDERDKLVRLGKTNSSDRLELVKRTSEAILIAFYNKVGGSNYKHDYIQDDGFIEDTIRTVLKYPLITSSSKNSRVHWGFLINRIGKKRKDRKVKLVGKWKFMYLDE